MAFLDHLLRTQGDSHVDAAEFPLHPGSPVKPDGGPVKPVIALHPELFQGLEGGLGTYPVGPVRVGKVPGHIDLVRVHIAHEFLDDIYIFLGGRILLDPSGFIEGKVEEMHMGLLESEGTDRSPGLAPADCGLDGKKFLRLRRSRPLGTYDFHHLIHPVPVTEFMGGVDMLDDDIIMDCEVAGCLIRHMDVMPLMNQPDERSSHGDHVVVGMGGEYQNLLGERLRLHGAGAVVGVGLASGPA